MLGAALIFVVIVFYAAKTSGPYLNVPEPELDETGHEEKERNKMTE